MAQWQLIKRDLRDKLGEGTLWSARDNAVYWTDIIAPALNRLSLADGSIDRWAMPEPIGTTTSSSDGGMGAAVIGGSR